ncbi:formate dehydrogenase accessory sulfurtransferase FdhD [Tomitella biformata]|uniref:formate dehydrogenase accessory sulfurtransferase FdhD n=1 Tax=Tomitella biformata TaxID=630403 RepID=UPI0004638258|nr:formate dehydrogenase accessory sulfurtransferase FdhD [Tomitella biformata]
MGRITARRKVTRYTDHGATIREDHLAVEEPMQIRIGSEPLAVTMRTPGHDIDLVHGFLLAEGIVTAREEIREVRYCAGADVDGVNTYNVLEVHLDGPASARERRQRNFLANSACGVCGTSSIDEVERTSSHSPADDPVTVDHRLLLALPDRLRSHQRIFDSTGGLHAAGLFTAAGDLVAAREDVGRHNAVDKTLGWALKEGRVPLTGSMLMLSGRASFELVQKASMAGVAVVVAVSAPSSLAVELAERSGITLVGFVRGSSLNVYSRPDRVL